VPAPRFHDPMNNPTPTHDHSDGKALAELASALQDTRQELSYLREERKKTQGRKGWETFWRILSVVLVPTTLVVGGFLINLDRRVTRIESSRFTATQGALMRADLLEAVHGLEGRIIAILSNQPPEAFVDRVDRLEHRVERLERNNGGGGEGGQ